MNIKQRTQIIAVGNKKGGVGKTSVTAHLAAALGERGLTVLAIDLDMNYGLTQHFGIEPEAYQGSFEILIGEKAVNLILHGTEEGVELPQGVHVIPSRRKLENIRSALAEKNKFAVPHQSLIAPLREIIALDCYDIVLLDTAPNATPLTLAAYHSADWFLLTAIPDPFAAQGLSDALQDIFDAQQTGNPDLRILGVVLSAVDKRTRLANVLSDYVETAFTPVGKPSLKFRTDIPRTTVLPTAQKIGKTTFQTDPDHQVTEQYRALAIEVIERLRAAERDAGLEDSGADNRHKVDEAANG